MPMTCSNAAWPRIRKTVNDFLAELLAATKSYADADYRTVSDYAATLGFKGTADALGLVLLHREIQG